MKTKLLHNVKSFEKSTSLFFKSLFVFILIIFSPFVLNAATLVSDSIPQNGETFIYVSPDAVISGESNIYFAKKEANIYVSSNAVIYGEENFSNAKIFDASKVVVEKNKTIAYQKPLSLSKVFVVNAKQQDKSTQKLQDRLNKKVKNTIYTSTSNRKYYNWEEIILSKQIFSTTSYSCNALAIADNGEIENAFTPQLLKSNFYTSFCYLESSKFRNANLRGPPTI